MNLEVLLFKIVERLFETTQNSVLNLGCELFINSPAQNGSTPLY